MLDLDKYIFTWCTTLYGCSSKTGVNLHLGKLNI